MKKKNWSLNAKIYLIVAVMAIGLSAVSVIGVMQMGRINNILEEITKKSVPRLLMTNDIMSLFYIQIINERNHVLQENAEAKKTSLGYIQKRDQELNTLLEKRMKIASEAGLKDLKLFKEVYVRWKTLNEEILIHSHAGDMKSAAALISESGRKIRTEGEAILDRMNERDAKTMNENNRLAEEVYSKSRSLVIIASMSALLFGVALSIYTLKMVDTAINKVISNLTDNSDQVSSAASQIAASSQELSQAVTEQAASLEETASSIEEMNSMVQKNADNANQARTIAMSSLETAGKGKKVINTMIVAIDDINSSNKNIMSQITHSNQQISEIVNVIKEIESKTKVINDIVFQTKLLSFNASVEAARAGEQGKGFAVVAEEVGNLAQMSGNAANEISVLLNNSIHKVESIVKETKEKVENLIKEGSEKVETGTLIAKECGIVLEEIVDNNQKVTKMTDEISIACQEQSLGVSEITRAINQLDQVTQTNSTASEESASAAEQLSAQALSLKSVVEVLVVTVKGGVDTGAQEYKVNHTDPVRTKALKMNSNNNVIEIPKKTTAIKQAAVKPLTVMPMKKASGMDNIPMENDSRFEEV